MINVHAASTILASAIVLGVIFVLRRNRTKETGKKHPPSLPALPFVESLPFLKSGMDELPDQLMRLSKKLGPVFSFYSGRNLAFVLNGKQAIVDALLKHAEAFADRPSFWAEVNILNPELRGLGFTHYNEAFKRYRKLTMTIFKEFGFGDSNESDIRIWNEVKKMNKTICVYRGRPFDPKVLLTHSTANFVMNILFGEEIFEKDLHNVIDGANMYLENIDPAIDMAPMIRFLPLYRKKIMKMKEAKEILFEDLEMAIKQIKSNKPAENSFVKRFLEIEGPNYDHRDLLFIIRDLCLGSSDTVVLALLWAMVEMANHPEMRARVHKEIDEVVPGGRFPSYNDRLHLPLTEATLLESARIHSLGPFLIPRSTIKDTQVCGYFIPKGCMVIPNVYSINMDPEIWTDPESFKPGRFLDEDQKVIGREIMVQFGLGKRACPGEPLGKQEVFVFFASLMQHFDLQPPKGQTSISVVSDAGLSVGPSAFEIRLIPKK